MTEPTAAGFAAAVQDANTFQEAVDMTEVRDERIRRDAKNAALEEAAKTVEHLLTHSAPDDVDGMDALAGAMVAIRNLKVLQ